MRYRNKRRLTVILTVVVSIVFLALCLFAGLEFRQIRCQESRIEELESQQSTFCKYVLVTLSDLQAGTILTMENVREEVLFTQEAQEVYMSGEQLGRELLVNVEAGTPLLTCMTREVTEATREVEIHEIELPYGLQAGERVDVRISFGNAEDYIVLSDKLVAGLTEKNGVVLCMTEEEILLFSSALYDCNAFLNTYLYVVKYPVGEQNYSGSCTYKAKEEVLRLIGKEYELGFRKDLEKRMEMHSRR